MVSTRLPKLSDKLRDFDIDHSLLSSLGSLRYFTGYTAPIETGPSPFTPLPGVLLWERGEKPQLFLADTESTEELESEIAVETFSSYTIERPLEAAADLSRKLVARLKKIPPGKVGIEAEDLPEAVLETVRSECPQLEFRDVARRLAEIRVVKDQEEIQTIRESLALCDLGQGLAKKLARPGITEVELFAEIRKGMEIKEGGRLPILADMVSGPRTAQVGGPPSARRIDAGDPIICDLVPRHKGYWGDSCNTSVAGEPTAEHRKFFSGIAETLAAGIEKVRPGLRASELDAFLRERVAKLGGGYPHHSGHGLGVTWHEEPRIVPYNTMALEAGMVIALEPGIYSKDRWGMRLEYVLRVTETGAEVLSKFKHTL